MESLKKIDVCSAHKSAGSSIHMTMDRGRGGPGVPGRPGSAMQMNIFCRIGVIVDVIVLDDNYTDCLEAWTVCFRMPQMDGPEQINRLLGQLPCSTSLLSMGIDF